MTLRIVIPCVAIAHRLQNLTESKCHRLHGHNYRVEVRIESTLLDQQGMVVDFSRVKELVNEYDHTFLGDARLAQVWYAGIIDHPEVEPSTAETFARVLCARIFMLASFDCVRVDVWETPGNRVTHRINAFDVPPNHG